MQIRISALLEEQAEALLKELRDKAIARIAVESPPSNSGYSVISMKQLDLPG